MMDHDAPIPCENCITLAMCLKPVYPKHSGTALIVYIDHTLMSKCSILVSYVYDTEYRSSHSQYRKVKDFYNKMLYGVKGKEGN